MPPTPEERRLAKQAANLRGARTTKENVDNLDKAGESYSRKAEDNLEKEIDRLEGSMGAVNSLYGSVDSDSESTPEERALIAKVAAELAAAEANSPPRPKAKVQEGVAKGSPGPRQSTPVITAEQKASFTSDIPGVGKGAVDLDFEELELDSDLDLEDLDLEDLDLDLEDLDLEGLDLEGLDLEGEGTNKDMREAAKLAAAEANSPPPPPPPPPPALTAEQNKYFTSDISPKAKVQESIAKGSPGPRQPTTEITAEQKASFTGKIPGVGKGKDMPLAQEKSDALKTSQPGFLGQLLNFIKSAVKAITNFFEVSPKQKSSPPPATRPPVAQAAKPPVAQAAKPPVAQAAKPSVAQAAKPSAVQALGELNSMADKHKRQASAAPLEQRRKLLESSVGQLALMMSQKSAGITESTIRTSATKAAKQYAPMLKTTVEKLTDELILRAKFSIIDHKTPSNKEEPSSAPSPSNNSRNPGPKM